MAKKPRFLTFLVVAVGLIAGLFIVGLIWASALDIPDFESFESRKVIQSTKIYDRTGQVLLYDVHGNIKRTNVALEEIPPNVKNATVAIEDTGFYNHIGISFSSIIRAFLANIKSGGISQGGSTITQQLVKNTFLTPEQTVSRKIKELVLALKVERVFSKDKILELYLNEIPYGASNYGVEAASESFFNKKVNELTLAEAAYLAALPKAPTYYSPYGPHRDALEERKNIILKRMLNLAYLTQEEYEQAKNEKVVFSAKGDESLKAPHFVVYIKNYLAEKYGEDFVEQGGLKVITTLDYNLQQKAETLVKKYAEENEKKFSAYNAGLVGLDPKTGQILVMVGSRDWAGESRPQGCLAGLNCKFEPKPNVTAYGKGRQPGSAFKPFVYATAFKKGFTPSTAIFDLPTEFNASCNPDGTPGPGAKAEECYHPQNYDNVFRGPITFREALAQSINVPSVKVLYLAGLKDSLETAKDMGITTLTDEGRYGLTLVLGGGEVYLLEMVNAYSVFAADGIKNPLVAILKVEDGQGKIAEEFLPRPRPALEPNIARLVNDILSDNEARAPAFGESSFLYFPERPVAVKTGTTNDYRDAWVIGYTPNFALGVWAGNNDNSSMEKKVAGFIAAPLWNAFLKEVFNPSADGTYSGLAKEEFIKPEWPDAKNLKPPLKGVWQGGQVYKIDKISKKLATKFTPPDLIEEKVLTQVHSILYWLNKNDPQGSTPPNYQDSQLALWEKPIRIWAQNQKMREQTEIDIPKELDDVHKPEYRPVVRVLSPQENMIFKPGGTIKVVTESQGHFPISQIDFFLNDVYLGSVVRPPFDFSFALSDLPASLDETILKLVVYDQVKNSAAYSQPIKIEN